MLRVFSVLSAKPILGGIQRGNNVNGNRILFNYLSSKSGGKDVKTAAAPKVATPPSKDAKVSGDKGKTTIAANAKAEVLHGVQVPKSAIFKLSNLNAMNIPNNNPALNPSPPTPSSKTTVLLKDLDKSVTEAVLKNHFKDIEGSRVVQLQPGCSIHVMDEAQAIYGKNVLMNKMKLDSIIVNTSLPSLMISNIPDDIAVETIAKSFNKYTPNSVHLFGSYTAQVTVQGAEKALKLSNIVNKLVIGDRTLHSSIVNMSNDNYRVNIYNFSASISAVETKKTLVEKLGSDYANLAVNITRNNRRNLLRFGEQSESQQEKIFQTLKDLTIKGHKAEMKSHKLARPALIIRNVALNDSDVAKLFDNRAGLVRLQYQRRSPDAPADVVVAYFNTEDDALKTMKVLQSTKLETHKKMNISYRDFPEPAVKVTSPSSKLTKKDLEELFKAFRPASIDISEAGDSAVVKLNSPHEVESACNLLNMKARTGKLQNVTITESNVFEYGIELGVDSSVTAADITKALDDLKIHPTSVSSKSNVSAVITFLHRQHAIDAHKDFTKDIVAFDDKSSAYPSRVTAFPSYALEVSGLAPDKPASECGNALEGTDIGKILKINRTGLIKFKRQKFVWSGIKQLRSMAAKGDLKYQPVRFMPVIAAGDEAYDGEGVNEEFDKFSLKLLLKDYMTTDPASRYAVAKNYFQRALYDARALGDITRILEDNVSDSIRQEASALLKQAPTTANTKRLFELYLQREDMMAFSEGFNEMIALYGDADESDKYDWSQFGIETDKDLKNMIGKIDELDKEALAPLSKKEIKRREREAQMKEDRGEMADEEDDKKILIKGENGDEEDQEVSLEDPSQLTDKEGRLWSGVILNTDIVQKTTPGNRVNSNRALVMIGNLRGAGGFGMGKGKTPNDAINSAFRAALRNILHIDLYDNFGLAHDLHGKHNACHAYIKATSRARAFVGSNFAQEILSRFGISSASVKLVGRRNPYSMVRAIFNALEKHENIDEYARNRGKRYLSIKWAYDNAI
jgi:small subunit ribosomal protein S5